MDLLANMSTLKLKYKFRKSGFKMFRLLTFVLICAAVPAHAVRWNECIQKLGPGLDPEEGPIVEMIELAEDISYPRKPDNEYQKRVAEELEDFYDGYRALVNAIADYCEDIR